MPWKIFNALIHKYPMLKYKDDYKEYIRTNHGHQSGPHFVDPDVVTVGAEAVDDDPRRPVGLKGPRRPTPRRRHVAR